MVINKEIEMELRIGDTISWVSAAGDLVGKISNVYIALSAADKMTPWITVSGVTFCASDAYLKMLKVTKVTEPEMKTVTNYMTGEKVEIPADTQWCCNLPSETYWSM